MRVTSTNSVPVMLRTRTTTPTARISDPRGRLFPFLGKRSSYEYVDLRIAPAFTREHVSSRGTDGGGYKARQYDRLIDDGIGV